MTLVLDAFSKSAASFTGSTSWSHSGTNPVGAVAVSIHDGYSGAGWDAISVAYGGVDLGSIRSQAAPSPGAVVDVFAFAGALPSGTQTITITTPGTSTLAKHVGVFGVLEDTGGSATYNAANAGAPGTGVTNPSVTVTHTRLLAGYFGGVAAWNSAGGASSSNLQTGLTFAATAAFTTANVAFAYRQQNTDASSSTYGYTAGMTGDTVLGAAVLADVPALPFVPRRMPLGV
jgi:hypothetical protein